MSTVGSADALVEELCGDLSSIRAPRGSTLNARSWATEAPLRMLLNNLDPEVAERPEELIVYGGSGKAARNHAALRALVRSLLSLGEEETLLVQSGKPVGVFRTHAGAPRVLIANSLLVPKWATWEEFRRLEAEGLTMFGQMTAGSWIYIGTQGILQGTYQTFAAAGEKHFGTADLAGRTILTAGLGGMGGAQPLAATMAGAACLCIEVDPSRIERRLETRYLDEAATSLDDALARMRAAAAEGRALSVGLARERGGNRAGARAARRGFRPRHRPDGRTRSAERLRARGAERGRGRRASRARPGRLPASSPCLDRRACARAARVRPGGQLCFRLWQQPERGGARGRARRRIYISGLRPGLYSAALLPWDRPLSVGCPLGRARRHRGDRPASGESCSRTTCCSSAGSSWRRTGSPSRACRPGSAGSATALARSQGLPSTSWCVLATSEHRW